MRHPVGCSCTHKILFRSTRVREFQRAMLAKTQLPTSHSLTRPPLRTHTIEVSQASDPLLPKDKARLRRMPRVRQRLTACSWLRIRAQPCVRARRRQIRLLQLNLRLRASLDSTRIGSPKRSLTAGQPRRGAKRRRSPFACMCVHPCAGVCACSSMRGRVQREGAHHLVHQPRQLARGHRRRHHHRLHRLRTCICTPTQKLQDHGPPENRASQACRCGSGTHPMLS